LAGEGGWTPPQGGLEGRVLVQDVTWEGLERTGTFSENGLAGGRFKDLVEWMRINEAERAALDYVYHPKFKEVKERFVKFKRK
jgi:hypothetical protein